MRKTTRLIILLLVVSVIYFGYSTWVDSFAIYNISNGINYVGTQMGSTGWSGALDALYQQANGTALPSGTELYNVDLINQWVAMANEKVGEATWTFKGFMAHNSLAKSLLDPFKMILVGGVFAMFIPLVKNIFFGTFIGIKGYLKARQTNVLYNYQKSIQWANEFKALLEKGNHEDIKAKFSSYSGLAFKPKYLDLMMDEVSIGLLQEKDLSVYASSTGVIVESMTEMYEKERKLAIRGRGNEMFFDLKRGYEYTSVGSKYSIAYFKSLPMAKDSQNSLAWKVFSLEMYKFITYLIIALIPTFFVAILMQGLTNGLTSSLNGDVKTLINTLIPMLVWTGTAVALHATVIFTKKEYINLRTELIKPALAYYGLLVLMFVITIPAGMVGMSKVGDITGAGTSGNMWIWFSALGYLILTSCLVLYMISTLMDGFASIDGMTNKLLVDGIVLPAVAWVIATAANFTSLFIEAGELQTILALINNITLYGFWIYLFISGALLNNIVLPSTRKKMALIDEMAQQGKEAQEKRAAQN